MSVEYMKEQMLNPRMLPQQCVGQTLRKVHSPITGVLTEIAFTLFENNLWETLLFSVFIVFTVCVHHRIRCFEELRR